MISRRPSIFIYTFQPDPDFLREIRAGIEEEGVFCEVFSREEADVNELAYAAAADSMLGSGIGLSGTDAAMQMRGLQKGRNAESYHMPTYEQCRRLGANSARAIKKMALK
jgi:hypothetical protein